MGYEEEELESEAITAQRTLEQDCVQAGVATYRERVARFRAKGMESLSDPVSHLLRICIEPTSRGLVDWIIKNRKGPGRRAVTMCNRAHPRRDQSGPQAPAITRLPTALPEVRHSTEVQPEGPQDAPMKPAHSPAFNDIY